ncbi:hypothetical protein P8C59_001005 [Phyllachora maydis]|uniref:Uncharacterized protein n=1 Tax=Phyllachora maydis TaxID=1825666 RepID=A0AAD9HXC0_9PEZI|nr:hypothetical protein P8C59_001005 [Phyllachora maydis]
MRTTSVIAAFLLAVGVIADGNDYYCVDINNKLWQSPDPCTAAGGSPLGGAKAGNGHCCIDTRKFDQIQAFSRQCASHGDTMSLGGNCSL